MPKICIVLFSIVGLGILAGPLYAYYIESNRKDKINLVRREALAGNKNALIMVRCPYNFKDEDLKLIQEGLNGNKNALIIMGYELLMKLEER